MAKKIEIPTEKIVAFFKQLPDKIVPFIKSIPDRLKNFPKTFQAAPTDEKVAYCVIGAGMILFLLGIIF
ncbi:MAG: hypothetical protein KJ601_02035 [Nanoarchaeota archaeon]|nr:hypothetical protein [Nanoarchaeota archaeon]